MTQATTLSDFTNPDPDSPAGRLRAIVDEPSMHDFGEGLWHGGSPTGIDAARECDDPELLREYRDLVADYCDPFSDNPQMRRIADDVAQYLNELDDRITAAEYPHPTNWPVEEAFIDYVSNLDYAQRHSPAFDRYGWYDVNDRPTEDLTFIRKTLDTVYNPGRTTAHDDILKTLLYYREESDVGVRDLVRVENRGKGASPTTVYHNLERTLDALHPVMAGMVVRWLKKITTNKTQKTNAGTCNYTHRTINIRSDTRLRDSRGQQDCTVAHEFGHALHTLYGYQLPADADIDNRGRDPCDWDWNIDQHDSGDTLTQQDALWTTVALEWDRLRDGDLDPLEEYQTKNAVEFFAVAFEYWVAAPDYLTAVQPRMKQLLDAHFGPESRAGS